MKEEELLAKRLEELAKRSELTNQFQFTDFLSLSQQSVFYQMQQKISYASPCLWGGTKDCERKMIRFGDEMQLGYEVDFPIVALKISPLAKKFSEVLQHRDYLGAILNLGIQRELIGDIWIREQEAFFFCQEHIASFLQEELTRVKHTNVNCQVVEEIPKTLLVEKERKTITVPSCRCDAIIAGVWNLSRSQALTLFRGKKVFLEGRLEENNSRLLLEERVVSVRGYGKFALTGEMHQTRKGKWAVEILLYK